MRHLGGVIWGASCWGHLSGGIWEEHMGRVIWGRHLGGGICEEAYGGSNLEKTSRRRHLGKGHLGRDI